LATWAAADPMQTRPYRAVGRRHAGRHRMGHNRQCCAVLAGHGHICGCGYTPKYRHDHQLEQDPRWTVEQHPTGPSPRLRDAPTPPDPPNTRY